MRRFTAGLLLGSTCSGIAYACGASPLWTGLVGGAVALAVWCGARLKDFAEGVADAVEDLF